MILLYLLCVSGFVLLHCLLKMRVIGCEFIAFAVSYFQKFLICELRGTILFKKFLSRIPLRCAVLCGGGALPSVFCVLTRLCMDCFMKVHGRLDHLLSSSNLWLANTRGLMISWQD
ncbi:hypothetical protein ACOSP7_013703 [Xanthoceras sorbifolium]